MLDDRKSAILRAVVECHIQTAQPVSSAYVAQLGDLAVSPATVRNEMVVLEQEGYLYQPHASAGRVPTDKGYRFFVDSLPARSALSPAQAELVRLFFARAHGELEGMLAETSGLLSKLTDYAAVVVAPAASDPGPVRSFQLVKVSSRMVLAVAVLANAAVERRPIELSQELSDAQVERASASAAAFVVGAPADSGGLPGPTGDAAVDALAEAAVRSLRTSEPESGPGHVFVGGAARMATAFEAVGTIRSVLGILEEQYVLVALLKDVLDRGLTVAIGAENRLLPLADCSVVVAPYDVDGERAGTVGVLGPTRMHYDQTLAAVAVVSRKLSKVLRDSGDGGGAGNRAAQARDGQARESQRSSSLG
jgi:heat-inducible transcriptional repressor